MFELSVSSVNSARKHDSAADTCENTFYTHARTHARTQDITRVRTEAHGFARAAQEELHGDGASAQGLLPTLAAVVAQRRSCEETKAALDQHRRAAVLAIPATGPCVCVCGWVAGWVRVFLFFV